MALNIITAKFCSGATQAWASEAWQYDYGQVLQFDGVDMPEAYQVHFSNEPMTGETITQIGNADGVSIPDQFFQNGEPIFAWVYLHEGEDDGETVYMVTIPVKKRPQPSDEVPTPVEQSAIDQAIAALNIAVEKADEAITHYPTIIDGTWHVWDVTTGEYVDTGVEARGPQGEHGETGPQGEQGEPGTPGAKGAPGADGVSPTVTVTEITGGHRVTITDASGDHTFDVLDGEDGTTPTVDSAMSSTSENPVQNKVITQELTDVKEDLNDKADVIISTASGSIAHFEDGAEADAVSVIAHIEPVQDLHGYDSPWPAGGGKNLLDPSKRTVYSDGKGQRWYESDGFTLKANQAYTFSVTYANPIALYIRSKSDGTILVSSNQSATYTPSEDTIVYFQAYRGESISSIDTFQLELGSTATSFAPYSNICPISGWDGAKVTRTGKNLLNPKLYSGGTYNPTIGSTWNLAKSTKQLTNIGNGQFSVTLASWAFRVFVFDLADGQSYTFRCNFAGTDVATSYGYLDEDYAVLAKYNETGATVNISVTFTGTSEMKRAYVGFAPRSSEQTLTLTELQLELGSTATAYEPYQGETYPITFPTEAGTVYGGYVDVTNGKLVVDRAMVDLGALTWSGNQRFTAAVSDSLKAVNSGTIPNWLCSSLKVASPNAIYANTVDYAVSFYSVNLIQARVNSITDATSFKASMSGVQLVYELATPITYDLTPQQIAFLLGVNNVWNDANGDTDIEYRADTKLYIEQLTKPTENDMIANANIASGKFFMVGNRLFLSTTAIAEGATIEPGTNCTEISLADALNQVNA